jgi:hypothetical protein
MSERTHKRKRSLQDSTVDLSKMRMALNRLEALKEELDGIEETEEELRTISEHFTALEDILKGAKKPVCCISLTLSVIIIDSDALESNFLNRFIRRPQEGRRQEETSRFCARENSRLNEGADIGR